VNSEVRIRATVSVLGRSCFERNKSISTVLFEDGTILRRIERYAFFSATVKTITIPGSVDFIDGSAFTACPIDSFSIAEDNRHFELDGDLLIDLNGTRLVKSFGTSREIVIPKYVTILGPSCCASKKTLAIVSFEPGSLLKRIDAHAFFDTSLKEIEFPPFVDQIDGSAFMGTPDHRFSVHPNNPYFTVQDDFLLDLSGTRLVRYIGVASEVSIRKEIKIIGKSCFASHKTISAITFEENSGIKRIESYAFFDSNLKSLSLPSCVEFIDGSALRGCSFDSFTLDPANPCFRFENNMLLENNGTHVVRFVGKESRVLIPSGVTTIGRASFEGMDYVFCIDLGSPSSVTTIDACAFWNSALKSLYLPASVTSISGSAFVGCHIEAITIAEDNPYFSLDEECLIEVSRSRLVFSFSTKSVLCIGADIEIVAKSAFESNEFVSMVSFEEGSRLQRVESLAFIASGLRVITIPKNVNFIHATAFERCGIDRILVADGNEHFCVEDRFLIEIPQRRLVRYFGTDLAIIVPNDFTVLGNSCFCRCPTVMSISFEPQSRLVEIEGYALYDTEVRSVTIPHSVERINGSAFSRCDIREIVIEEGNLHFRVENDCLLDISGSRLVRYFGTGSVIQIGKDIVSLGRSCLGSQRFLMKCTFEEGSMLRSIEQKAFWKCTLMSIELPPTVRFVGRKAFESTCDVFIPEIAPDCVIEVRNWQTARKNDPRLVLDLGFP
jgi:hypothetical protein